MICIQMKMGQLRLNKKGIVFPIRKTLKHQRKKEKYEKKKRNTII